MNFVESVKVTLERPAFGEYPAVQSYKPRFRPVAPVIPHDSRRVITKLVSSRE